MYLHKIELRFIYLTRIINVSNFFSSHLSNSSTDEQERGGEETETAPEGEPEDDSITRCICDFLHDDGYTWYVL